MTERARRNADVGEVGIPHVTGADLDRRPAAEAPSAHCDWVGHDLVWAPAPPVSPPTLPSTWWPVVGITPLVLDDTTSAMGDLAG